MRKLIALVVMALMLVSMVPGVIADENETGQDGVDEREEDPLMCAADVKECPDGSFVPRDPENDCEFKPCTGEDDSDEEDSSAGGPGEDVPQRPRPAPAARDRMADRALDALRGRFGELSEAQREKLGRLGAENARKFHVLKEDALERVAGLDEDELEKFAALGRARAKELADKTPDEIREELKNVNVKRVKASEAFQKRELPPQAAERARERYEEAADKYRERKDSFYEEREDWREAVRQGDEEAAVSHAKNYLMHAADMVIGTAEKVRARVEANDDLSEGEADEILADLNETVENMEAAKEAVETAETKDEVKAAARAIQESWKRHAHQVRVRAHQAVKTDVGEILSRSRALESRLDSILAEMEARNVTVENLDHLLTTFSEKVDEARELYEESEVLFEQAKDERDKDALQRSKELSREAHEKLREAHRVLVDIVRKVKQEGFDIEDDGEYVEVIEEDDDELEVEVEVVGDRSFVEVEFGDDEFEFVLNATDNETVFGEIASRTGLNVSVVRDVAEFEYEEDDDEAEDESDDTGENATNTTA
ncbi:MAG: hypothetical protein ACLFO2_01015 [Candidatus Woesearchaeota archaeon]